MNHLYRLTLRLVFAFVNHLCFSQSAPQASLENGASFFVPVTPQQFVPQQTSGIFQENLFLSKNDQFVLLDQQPEQASFSLDKFQQYYKGVKVEYGIYKVHSKNGMASAISGEYYKIPETLNLQPLLSKEQAIQKALSFVGAQTYKWQIPAEEAWLKKNQNNPKATYYPEGELVICKIYRKNQVLVENGNLTLAYKFDIFAHEPISRAYIYVDAQTGTIIHQDAIIKHADGTAQTRFSGQRTISTTLNNTYQLRDSSRGSGVEIYNMQRGTSYGTAIDFTDNDNNWTTSEHDNLHKDNAALDCHWGAMKTYDYFRDTHGRNSFDGNGAKIRCYVHYGNNYVNAFWDGSVMTFGDGEMTGSTGIQPLTTLDITAHEIAHAVCQYTAGLVYSYESGAMNEGFSDIWGAMVEYYADPTKSTWTMGEDANFTIRSMSNPNAYQHPDTYKGQYWYEGAGDNGGVHYNSGVLNHWFYLLCIGKDGVNDNGDAYNVTGIGIEKAARIAYRLESVYLTANSQYKDARTFSIQAATDLFGANSQEAIQTANAWYAVGVYDIAAAPSNLTATAISGTQINLAWTDNATNETGFQIERSTNATTGFTQVATVGANVTSYANTGLPTDAVYYYRVKATLGTTSSTYSNTASAVVGTPPLVMVSGSAITCGANFLDPGGISNYGDYQYTTMTLTPTTTDKKLKIVFTTFDTEQDYDLLRIYDGDNIYAPLIGEYSGTSLPPAITATNPTGQLTFVFTSNSAVNGSGWQATISCITPPNAPMNLVASTISGTQIDLSWSDNSADETGFQIERSTSANSGFAPIATVEANLTSYANTDLITDAFYYYRVKAIRADLSSSYSNIASAAVGNAPVIMSNTAITTCDAIFLDPGGADNYDNLQQLTMTLSPADQTKKLHVVFSSFSTEACCDYLRIYDGADVYAPLIGIYYGNTLPPALTASNPGGHLTFSFYSDGSVTGAGWQAKLSCVNPAAPAVVAMSPAKHTNNAALSSPITLSFSQLMQAATASAASIKIHGSLTGLLTTPAGGSFSGAGTAAVSFDPAMELKAGETISVTVTTEAKNQAGIALAAPQLYQFTTAAAPAAAYFLPAPALPVADSAFALAAADFDADGDIDLAAAHFLPAGTVSILLNNGTGSFSATASLAVGAQPKAVAAADLDNDGDMDLAIANYGANTVSLLLNDGTGVFSATAPLAVAAAPASLAAADFDADGDMDLAIASYSTNTVSLLLNDGTGSFSPTTSPAVGANPAWVQSADLDSDGDMDLAIANYGANTVSILLNDGAGVFSATTPLAVGVNPTGIALADLDGDKDIDLAVANSAAGTLSIGFNNGLAEFATISQVSAAGGVWAVVAADLDGDADMDLATANYEANSVSIHLNNGGGVFSAGTLVEVAATSRAITAADFDKDADIDLVTAHFTSNSLSILPNVYPPTISYFSPTSGPIGTSVVINGSNFRNVTSVQFHNTSATNFTINSDYQITAVVPAGATKGSIKVTSLGGTTTSSGIFTVTSTPTITSFSPVSGAAGTTIVITGTNFNGVSSLAINGSSANYILNTPTQITAVIPLEATTGPISINLVGGVSIHSTTDFTVLSGISMSYTPIFTCNDIYRDSDGSSDYGNNLHIIQTFTPATAEAKLRFTFTSFDIEEEYDYLRIYDGANTYAPLIGEYSGTSLPPAITATNPTGQLTFVFTSDDTFTGAGWEATITCTGPPIAPSSLTATAITDTAIHLSWSDNSTDETGFVIERSTSATTGFALIASVDANVTAFANNGLPTNTLYYYRVRAIRADSYSAYSNIASAAVGNAPIIMSNTALTTCNALFLDPGGADNYANYQELTMTLSPADSTQKLHIAFTSFSTEACCDYLRIYDGASISAPLIGTYYGDIVPPALTATNPSGQLTFRFSSDGSGTGAGWQAHLSCLDRVAPSITAINPLRHTTNAARYSNISVSFSQLMQAATASAASIHIHGSLTGLLTTPAGGTFSGAGTASASFDPSVDLKAGETVSVSVTTNAKNQADVPLAAAQLYQFTAASAAAAAHFVAAPALPVAASPFALAAADFDKDGDVDLATAQHVMAGTVSIHLNDGTGSFPDTTWVMAGDHPRDIAAADFDKDGDIDLAIANQLSNNVSICFNNGAGLFSAPTTVAVGVNPVSIVGADFDADGDMDIATANYGAGTVSICFNNGEGAFSGTTTVAVGVHPAWLQAADLDNDADLDLAVANYGAGSVSIRLNNGAGAFSGTTQVVVGVNPTGIALADLDGDKDIDLAVANSAAGTLSIGFNNGLAEFSTISQVSAADGAWAVLAADLDGDADMDLAVANDEANSVSIRLNNGEGVFSAGTSVEVGTTPRAITAADFDKDGDLDLATANFASNSLSILNNVPLSTNINEAESNTEKESNVYPNPFKDEFTIIIRTKKTQEVSFTIIDVYGKEIYTIGRKLTNHEITINKPLTSGVYILKASYGDKVELFKIIKSE